MTEKRRKIKRKEESYKRNAWEGQSCQNVNPLSERLSYL